MLKLLIVDDEPLVIELIIRCIDWEEIGYEIVGKAFTAEEAEALTDELQPDVIFTDVRMPEHTGLELARAVLSKYTDIKIIMISGYDEFSYVNEGLKIGIFDYILKPIAEETLLEVACRVRDVILKEREHNDEFERLKLEFEQNFEVIREKHIERLVTSQNVELVAENLAFFDIKLNEGCYQAAILEYSEDEEVKEKKDLLQSIQVRDIVNAFFSGYPAILLFEKHFQRIGIINNQPEVDFAVLCSGLQAELCKSAGICARIGIGERYKDLRQLSISYREACDVLTYGFSAEMERSIQYHEIFSRLGENPVMQDGIFRKFEYYMKQAMLEEAKETVCSTFTMLRECVITKEQAVRIAMRYVMEIFSAAEELRVSYTEDEKDETELIYGLLCLSNLKDMQGYICDLLLSFMDAFKKQNGTKNVSVVQAAEAYLKEHYQDPELSLAQIARELYVNPNYLSRIFKEKNGKSFREYLLDIRMEKALVLLRQTTLKSYEVAEKIGIKDPGYFSFCFKKKFGKSVQSMLRSEL